MASREKEHKFTNRNNNSNPGLDGKHKASSFRKSYKNKYTNSHSNKKSYLNTNNTNTNLSDLTSFMSDQPSINFPCLDNFEATPIEDINTTSTPTPTPTNPIIPIQGEPLLQKDSQLKTDDEVYFNPNNRLLTKDFVELTLFNVIGQKFSIHNLHFYQTAFVHASAYKKNLAPPNSKEPLIFLQTYESLEFMGDSWLGAIVTDYLYHRFPGQKEGFLTKIRAKIVREQQLIKFSEQLNFHRYVILPLKAEKMLGRNGSKFLEDVFEAFCGAIIEDLGVAVLQLFIKHMLERNVDFNDLILFDDDYKSMLLQFHQRHGWPHPTYTMINQEGPGHKKQFIMGVNYIDEFDNIKTETPLSFELVNIKTKHRVCGQDEIIIREYKIFVTGKGKSKKEAEQEASKKALEVFGMLV
jgi:ribonuclease III